MTKCLVSDCDDKVRSRGVCFMHYGMWRRGKDIPVLEPRSAAERGAMGGRKITKKTKLRGFGTHRDLASKVGGGKKRG